MIVPVLIALAGAFFMALGSALQERDAVRAPGRRVARFGLLLHLVQRPRWIFGTLAAGAGVALHLIALSGAPLTIIQPIGVTGLLFAIVLSMAFTRRRVRPGQIAAGVAVMAGLTGVLLLFPHTSTPPRMTVLTALLLAGCVFALGIAGLASARHLSAGARGVALAAIGGAALGTTSAIARVVAAGAVADPMSVVGWLPLIAAAVALFGGLMMQNAYRTGHFAAAYAILLVADPVVGAGLGALLLGEGLPSSPGEQALAALSAAVAAAGIAVLARSKNQNPEAARTRSPASGGAEGEHGAARRGPAARADAAETGPGGQGGTGPDRGAQTDQQRDGERGQENTDVPSEKADRSDLPADDRA